MWLKSKTLSDVNFLKSYYANIYVAYVRLTGINN